MRALLLLSRANALLFGALAVTTGAGLGLVSCMRSAATTQLGALEAPSAPDPQASTIVPQSSASSSAPVPSVAVPSTAPEGGSSSSSTAEPAVAPNDWWNRPEPPGSTRGTIACDGERCSAGKRACALVSNKWECVDANSKNLSSVRYCDDSSDCPNGLACCRNGATTELVQHCTLRHGKTSDCAAEVCRPGGAKCVSGQHCTESGFCVADLGATCPNSRKSRCGGDEVCEWTPAATTCVKKAEPVGSEEQRGLFGCTLPSDCGLGNECCTSSASYWHETGCAPKCDITNSTFVCRSAADCRRKLLLLPAKERLRAKLVCKPVGDGAPEWLKVCAMELPE